MPIMMYVIAGLLGFLWAEIISRIIPAPWGFATWALIVFGSFTLGFVWGEVYRRFLA